MPSGPERAPIWGIWVDERVVSKMGPLETDCGRAAFCLNFRRLARMPCSSCGADIVGNHFHATNAQYRLCDRCFLDAFDEIAQGIYRPPSHPGLESNACANFGACAVKGRFSQFRQKICDGCGQYPPNHFHDVVDNRRLCLSCFLSRRAHYEALISRNRSMEIIANR